MVPRRYWLEKIEGAWTRRPVLWLSGVRRAGKTFLTKGIPVAEYFDCELPSVRRQLEDPESFLRAVNGKRVVLDEVHRLGNPSEILKIAADHFPKTQVLATGSSSLAASKKFRDTLTGRKASLWLTPMISPDLEDFGRPDLKHRLVRGGLPPFFLAPELPEAEYQEWMDAYWAKDIQELFRLEKRHAFQTFFELLMRQSGGIFEATRFARPCEVSRATISNYLRALEETYIVQVLRPFSSGRATEIIAAPKVYGFDTGFVTYHRGFKELRSEDLGLLWEHFVLNELQARLQTRKILYWRDKRGHEVDLIISRRGGALVAIECKWSEGDFDPSNLEAFHRQYPRASSYLVAQDIERVRRRAYGELEVAFVPLSALVEELSGKPRAEQ
jgi:predicted AAA+ superfamily ATPase